ncbi:Asp/Glu/hydantoin racemase [Mycolicibacterium phlei]|uniref:Hydantoin racemase n=1 Tax=Mycolicibacterium phlei DSM 43239 = CCUG 21000 TaxID=1226750 RepID=A0A5N5UWQ8_MYCPH|nr:aspartate/glutamate racemase family protein [Mycolicibacterium phlei]VEG07721.1 Asp/Glu/hydantoin racemase [Mycobacteroides chelonae]AMO59592.1 Asp/Glu/Hydantoin racemase [Mycolicibacterium phlei]EID10771.1 hydantoin racemase [Mycolicibacterium phlei RIVM601174]KAB7753417.1 Asp/Glu racemase [Mycolicibacterium phlei DSM 43239 = CCUG 21000]KXW62320.1 Asp/Glu racemase [Mycolicibacterium phlei DSM 43239 = CCUG 21000]
MRTIWVINPNTTEAMTATIEQCARAVIAPGTTVTGVTSEIGPASIESHYDEAMAVPGLLRAIARGEAEGVDGYVIACFGDPGLDAARELAAGPVLGIAEAAMHTASHLGRGFSVVTTLARTMGRAWDLANHYGMQRFCRGVHACDIPVLNLETDPDARKVITEACRDAIEEDGSDVVVLGCAGMASMCAPISAELGVPVVDGVTAATLTVQSLITMGLGTSKRLEFAAPPPKDYTTGG